MKKIGLLVLALVLALGSLGVAYARWFDTVTVNGTISAGSVCWKFASARMLDTICPPPTFPTTNPDYTCNNGFAYEDGVGYFWPLDKNVACGSFVIGGTNNHTLTVTLTNTYPCNFNEIGFYVYNCGTIPIKVQKAEVFDNTGALIATFITSNVTNYAALDLGSTVNGLPSPIHDGNADIEIQYGDNFGAQIEPGPSGNEFSFWIHTLQAAPQGASLTFSIKISAVQWNEYVAPIA